MKITKKEINLIVFAIIAIIFVIVISIFVQDWFNNLSFYKYDNFAKCLKAKGAVFYGGFWCKHCKNQKELFGLSEKYLPYYECSTPDGLYEIQKCKDENRCANPRAICAS